MQSPGERTVKFQTDILKCTSLQLFTTTINLKTQKGQNGALTFLSDANQGVLRHSGKYRAKNQRELNSRWLRKSRSLTSGGAEVSFEFIIIIITIIVFLTQIWSQTINQNCLHKVNNRLFCAFRCTRSLSSIAYVKNDAKTEFEALLTSSKLQQFTNEAMKQQQQANRLARSHSARFL